VHVRELSRRYDDVIPVAVLRERFDTPRGRIGYGTFYGGIHRLSVVKPQNADGFVNWLTTHLSNALSQVAVMRTRARIEAVDGIEFCRIDVAASSAPITARMSDKAEFFWVRMNNSTRALPEFEVEDYVRDRW
jgi:hypothetical protein